MTHTVSQFRDAISQLIEDGQLSVNGERFCDVHNFKVFDDTHDSEGKRISRIDITPTESVLNQALTNFATQQTILANIANVKHNAKAQLNKITFWASATENEGLEEIENAILDVEGAKFVISALWQVIVSLRNEIHPESENG